MAVSNNIFTMKAVNDETTSALFSQLGGLLGVSRGEDGKYHIADLCTAGSIAIGARYKPFRNSSDNFGYDPNNPAPANAERARQSQLANFGISIPQTSFATIKDMADAVYNGTYKWEYLKPQGRANGSPFRIRDFDGYKHDAISPIRAEVASFEQSLQGTVAQINPYFRITRAGDLYQLSLEELRFDGTSWDYTFGNMYLGMCARRVSDGATYYGIMSQTYTDYLASTQHDEVSFGINVPTPSSGTYSYYCFPFFSTQPTISNASFFPVPMSIQTINVKRLVVNNYVNAVVNAWMYQDTWTPLYWYAEIFNNTQSKFGGSQYRYEIWTTNYNGQWEYRIAQGDIPEIEAGSSFYIPSSSGAVNNNWGQIETTSTQYLICLVYYNNSLLSNSVVNMIPSYINRDVMPGDEPFLP